MSKLPKQRIAIYARVSTADKGQSPENQLAELRQWCKQSGHDVVEEYADYESDSKGTNAPVELLIAETITGANQQLRVT